MNNIIDTTEQFSYNRFIANLEETDNMWDIIVLMYYHLVNGIKAISIHEAAFIRDYCNEASYLEEIRSYAYEQFITILRSNWGTSSYLLTSQKTSIINSFKIIKNKLNDNYSYTALLSTIYMFLVVSNSLVDDWVNDWDNPTIGKLNSNTALGYSIYLRETSMLSEAEKICKFYNPSLDISFTSCFPNLVFWKTDLSVQGIQIPLPEAPFFKDTNISLEDTKACKSITIAIIPLDCELLDNKSGNNDMNNKPLLRMKHRTSKSIYWEYIEDGINRIKEKTIRLISAALEHKPNIIVLPEYTISPEILGEIQKYISDNIIKFRFVQFVIAGTTWVTNKLENGTYEYDNICHILSINKTWKTYKAEGYCSIQENYIQGTDQHELSIISFDMIETLSHPAREITIPYIQSIGYVYIPICRDVINSERDDSITGKIANYIKPALIMKTLSFDVDTEFENYRDENNDYKRRFIGYKFTHTLKVDFPSDNELLGKTLFTLSQSNLAPEFRISYVVADPEAVKNELIGKAVEDAMKKAEVLAKAAGLTLGSIQTVDYSWGEINMEVRPMDDMLMSPCAGPCEMDIEPDDIDMSDTVTVVWEIT